LANPAEIGIARSPVRSNDRFLYHKTTRRGIYRNALAECPGFEDVILWNERGEVTESCIANVVVELDGELVTPPMESGLLPGTYRAWLLEQGRVKERRILLNELERCSQVYLVNSVRGMWKVGVCNKD
jgi:para-aminobenzoate synthetase/4-amino-4-deoxychorismate lyase